MQQLLLFENMDSNNTTDESTSDSSMTIINYDVSILVEQDLCLPKRSCDPHRIIFEAQNTANIENTSRLW